MRILERAISVITKQYNPIIHDLRSHRSCRYSLQHLAPQIESTIYLAHRARHWTLSLPSFMLWASETCFATDFRIFIHLCYLKLSLVFLFHLFFHDAVRYQSTNWKEWFTISTILKPVLQSFLHRPVPKWKVLPCSGMKVL